MTLLASKSGLIERTIDWLAERYVRSRELQPETIDEIVDARFDLRPFGEAGVEIADNDFRATFATFPRTTLVLNGKCDLLIRLGEQDHARANDDTQMQVIDGAGHACYLDQPGVYTSAVDPFLNPTVDVNASN